MARAGEELLSIVRFADSLPVAIWVGRAPGGEVVYVNREFEHILGLTPPEDAARGNYVGPYGVHRPTGEPYPEDQMPFERVLRSRKTEVIDDLVIHRHDGSRCWLRVFARPLFDEHGEIAYVVEAFTDRTLEVEHAQRRDETERQLQAVQRLESVGSLAGGIAHDFNNLLAIVKLVGAQLRHESDAAERIALAQHLDEVADSAAKLTRALLGFARRGTHASKPISVNAVAASIVELARRTFERRIELVAQLEAAPDVVLGDATQLEQVVMNLVMNARDALEGAAGRIVVRTGRETIGANHPVLAPGEHVTIEVEDTGTGIERSVVDRVFEPYVSTKTLGAAKGTGLGLATVYGIARAHGGTAEVARTSPHGTTMRVSLPASSAPAESTEVAETRVVLGTGTILVVDDEPLVLHMTARTLESLGYAVITAASGRDALDAYRAAAGRVDAVVLDMTMADMDGRETFLALRAIDPDVRVLLVTGYALDHDAQEIVDLGVRGFLAKPASRAQLSQSLAEVLGRAGDL